MSLLRLACAPAVALLILRGEAAPALWLLAGAGALDWADGAVARRWPSQASLLGAFLDPLADKALLAASVLPLAATGGLHPALAALVVGRDAALVAGSLALRARAARAPGEAFFSLARVPYSPTPTLASKLNTAAQLALVAAALAAQAAPRGAVLARLPAEALPHWAAEALRAAEAAAGVAAGDAAGVALTAAPLVDALSLAVAASTIATGVSYWFRHGHTRVR